MSNEDIINNAKPIKITSTNLPITSKTIHRKEPLDKAYLEQELLRFLDNQIEPVPMREAARLIGCNVRTLYHLFSELCQRISARHAIFRKERAKETKDKINEEVRRAIIELRAKGIDPSRSDIARFLNKPHYRCSGIILPALREALRALDYPSSGSKSLPRTLVA